MKNNYGKTAFILSIVALTFSELVLALISLIYSFINMGWNDSLAAVIGLTLLAGPIVMGIVALSLLPKAKNNKRVFVILTRIFSIFAIVIGAILCFYYALVYIFIGAIA